MITVIRWKISSPVVKVSWAIKSLIGFFLFSSSCFYLELWSRGDTKHFVNKNRINKRRYTKYGPYLRRT